MKKLILTLFIGLVAALGWLSSTFTAAVLDVGPPPKMTLPTSSPPQNLSIKAISSGKMFSKAGLAFRGGDLNEERIFSMGGLLIQHPEGNLLIDAGFASNVDEHVATTPKLMQMTSSYEAGTPVSEQLLANGIQHSDLMAVILTHAHWDHVSGLADLPNTPVWVTQAELDFIHSGAESASLARLLGTHNYTAIHFNKERYLGFDNSFDVFGDGSVVLVPASGHTPGSVIVFVTLSEQHQYAFIGDLAWQKEGVDWPAEKPWLPRHLVGENPTQVSQLLVHMHHLQTLMPNLIIVPSHDQNTWESLPTWP